MNPDLERDLELWVAALGAFVAGDMVTTSIGLDRTGVEEAHPVSEWLMQVGGQQSGMAAGKTVVVAAAVAGYVYAARHPETNEYRQAFPLFLLVVGLGIVTHNLRVISQA